MAEFGGCQDNIDSIRTLCKEHEFLSRFDLLMKLGVKTFRDVTIISLDELKKAYKLTYIEQTKLVDIQIECANILKLDSSNFIVNRKNLINSDTVSTIRSIEDENSIYFSEIDPSPPSGFDTPPTSLQQNSLGQIEMLPTQVPTVTENSTRYEIKRDQAGYIGLGIIVMNIDYQDEKREGGEQDYKMIKEIFGDMGLKIVDIYNKESDILIRNLEEILATHQNFLKNTSCLFMAISSHGSEDSIFCVNREFISISEKILPLFKSDRCESLQSKPKIFLIHACRGGKIDYEIQADYCAEENPQDNPLKTVATIESDILIAYSCVQNYKSWRDVEKGSWYIQALKETYSRMKNDENKDIYSILTLTNQYLLSEFEYPTLFGRRKQPSQFTSSLTRLFKFP